MSTKLTDQDLALLGQLFEASAEIADPDGFDPLPDGQYMCQVVSAEITKTKTTNKLMATWQFKVVEGEEGENRRIFKNSVVEDNAKNMKRFLNDVEKFGVEATDLIEVLAALEGLVDEICLVQLKTDAQNRQWATIEVPEM